MATRDADFTVYVPAARLAELDRLLEAERSQLDLSPLVDSPLGTRECNLRLPSGGFGRALVCRCFGGRSVSVTVRRLPGDGQAGQGINWPLERPADVPSAPQQLSGWPSGPYKDPIADVEESVRELTGCLQLDSGEARLAGLIVVSGRTGSGKSTVAFSLMLAVLNRLYARHGSNERPPHIVTFEDPIETWFASSPEEAQRAGFDFTPRQKGMDASDLSQVVNDALRQTTDIVYAGETRSEDDWKALLRFAGTGHLVVTTAHAGSLLETMSHILRAAQAKTPAERSAVAKRIQALIHIRGDDVAGVRVRVPALWRSTAKSVSGMTAEGLASMMPQAVESTSDRMHGCYGRTYFVRQLSFLKKHKELAHRALSWDLAGE